MKLEEINLILNMQFNNIIQNTEELKKYEFRIINDISFFNNTYQIEDNVIYGVIEYDDMTILNGFEMTPFGIKFITNCDIETLRIVLIDYVKEYNAKFVNGYKQIYIAPVVQDTTIMQGLNRSVLYMDGSFMQLKEGIIVDIEYKEEKVVYTEAQLNYKGTQEINNRLDNLFTSAVVQSGTLQLTFASYFQDNELTKDVLTTIIMRGKNINDKYRFKITFSNGLEREIDFKLTDSNIAMTVGEYSLITYTFISTEV